MSFKHYTCWTRQEADRVTNPVALGIDNATFAAVHTPMHLRVQHGTASGESVAYTEDELLADFLSQDADHQFYVARGTPGCGKSHLIRWLSTQIPPSDDRHVILIPRAKTNLRGVIDMLLQDFEGGRFDRHRERLKAAVTPPTPEAGRARLLDSLAHAIEYEYEDGDVAVEPQDRHAAERLPDLLREPYFRRAYWLREEGVLARLYDRALGKAEKGIGQGEEDRVTEADLPQDLDEADTASKEVIKFYGLLNTHPQVRDASLRVLNRHLKIAVQNLLNFSGENLFDLFTDLRRTLYEEGKELVLLIEDVARQQGLSGAILEALIVDPMGAGNESLCTLRSIVGITPEPFDLLPGNIRGRITKVVDLDGVPEDKQETMLVSMASRYLNAARLSPGELAAWYESEEDTPPPSKCLDCPFKEKCHEAFGERLGYGLYPFNATALREMYRRKGGDELNPRTLLRDVLEWPLVQGREEIQQGRFPSGRLHEQFGGSRGWAPGDLNAVKKDPAHGHRRLALLDLWSKEKRPVDLADPIHEAFDLPPLGTEQVVEPADTPEALSDISDAPSAEVEPSTDAPTKPEDDLGQKDQKVFHALTEWANGETIQMNAVNALRKRLRAAVANYIDWDGERLVQSAFYGNQIFENKSINFEGQVSSYGSAEIRIVLPFGGQGRAAAAEGIQAMLLHEHYRHWRFDGGPGKLLAYADLLESVAAEVVRQIRHPMNEDEAWSPGIAAAEVLRLGARAAGEPSSTKTTLPNRLDALFASFPDKEGCSESASRPWRDMQGQFAACRASARDMLKAYHSCPKGGQASNWHLDSAPLIDVLNRRDLKPRTPFPVDSANLPRRLRGLHELVVETEAIVAPAVEAEEERWTAWYETMSRNLGDSDALSDTKAEVKKAISALKDVGQFRFRASILERFEGYSRTIRTDDYRHLYAQASKVAAPEGEGELTSRLRELGYLNRKEVAKTAASASEYVSLASDILETSLERLKNQVKMMGDDAGGDALDGLRSALDGLEASLIASADTVEAGPSDPDNEHAALAVAAGSEARAASYQERGGHRESDEAPSLNGEQNEESSSVWLVALSYRVRAMVKVYREAEAVKNQQQQCAKLRDEHQEHLDEWTAVQASREALQQAGVPLQAVMDGSSLAEDIRRQRELIESDLENYLQGTHHELRKNCLRRLKYLIEERRTKTEEDWRAFINRETPPYSPDLMSVLGRIPALSETVREVRKAYRLLEGKKEKAPSDASEVALVVDIAKDMRAHLSQMMGETEGDYSLPPAVQRFLQEASQGTAPLDSLTSEVEAWLHERGLYDSFSITVKHAK
jgi:hypothetical protein